MTYKLDILQFNNNCTMKATYTYAKLKQIFPEF